MAMPAADDGTPDAIDPLVDLLRHWAQHAPGAVALADPPNRPDLGLGSVRSLTFAEADALADRIAAEFADAGLAAGSVIALQLPNIWEGVLVLLGAWRAGLTVCPLPLAWRLTELGPALAQIEPAAIVTAGRFAGHGHAETMRRLAADQFSIRFIFALGEDLPDGVTPIADWLAPGPMGRHGGAPHTGQTAAGHDPAILTWAVSPGGPYPVPRSHDALAALGDLVATDLALTSDDVLLGVYPLSTVAGLAGHVMPWLRTGARLQLHQAFDFDLFLTQLRAQNVTYTALPGPVLQALGDGGHLAGQARELTRVGCVWPVPHAIHAAADMRGVPCPIFDMHNLSELAFMVRRREADGDPDALPLGRLYSIAEDPAELPYLETRVRGSVSHASDGMDRLSGELLVRGTTVPKGPFDGGSSEGLPQLSDHGYLDTHIRCTVDETLPGRFRCERHEGLFYLGGAVVAAEELDALYAEHPDLLDAVAVPIDDPVMGDRIVAAVVPRPDTAPSLAEFHRFLGAKYVAAYKHPDQLVIVEAIPRDDAGRILRDQILI